MLLVFRVLEVVLLYLQLEQFYSPVRMGLEEAVFGK